MNSSHSPPLLRLSDAVDPVPLHLIRLPDVPLQRIMRYIEGRSLDKIRLTSRFLNKFIVLNRGRLVQRKVSAVYLMRIADRHFNITYDLTVLKDNEEEHHAPNCMKGSSQSVFGWLTTTFRNCHIKSLTLQRFCFDEENMEEVEKAIMTSKLRCDSIMLVETAFIIGFSSSLRFVYAISSSFVHFTDSGTEYLSHFFTDAASSCMADLHYIENETNASSRDSLSFMRIPAYILTNNYDLFTIRKGQMSTLLNRIRNWHNNEIEATCWWISIAHNANEDDSDVTALAARCEVPYEIVYHDARHKIRFRKNGGKNLYVYSKKDPALETTVWSFEDASYYVDI